MIEHLVLLALFTYASYRDIKTHTVSNFVWVVTVILGFLFSISKFIHYPFMIYIWTGTIIVTTLLSVGLYVARIWGGADCKALISISIITPTYPSWFTPLLGQHFPVFPLTVLENSILTASFWILYLILKRKTVKEIQKQPIPFIPFMTIGIVLTILIGDPIATIYSNTFL